MATKINTHDFVVEKLHNFLKHLKAEYLVDKSHEDIDKHIELMNITSNIIIYSSMVTWFESFGENSSVEFGKIIKSCDWDGLINFVTVHDKIIAQLDEDAADFVISGNLLKLFKTTPEPESKFWQYLFLFYTYCTKHGRQIQ